MFIHAHTHTYTQTLTHAHARTQIHTGTQLLTCSTELAKKVRKTAPNGPTRLLAGLNTSVDK